MKKATFTFSVSFRSAARGSSGAFCSSAIAKAITSSQTTSSDPFRLTEILPEKVKMAHDHFCWEWLYIESYVKLQPFLTVNY